MTEIYSVNLVTTHSIHCRLRCEVGISSEGKIVGKLKREGFPSQIQDKRLLVGKAQSERLFDCWNLEVVIALIGYFLNEGSDPIGFMGRKLDLERFSFKGRGREVELLTVLFRPVIAIDLLQRRILQQPNETGIGDENAEPLVSVNSVYVELSNHNTFALSSASISTIPPPVLFTNTTAQFEALMWADAPCISTT